MYNFIDFTFQSLCFDLEHVPVCVYFIIDLELSADRSTDNKVGVAVFSSVSSD